MRIQVRTAGPRPSVLLREPGPAASDAVHSLLDQGAVVTVWTSTPDDRLSDLASRGLVTLSSDPDPDGYDVVVRDRGAAEPSRQCTNRREGSVTLVGGGPGAPGLLTVAGRDAIRAADVVVCDRLAPLGVLDQVREGAEIVHVGKIPRGPFTPQKAINDLLVTRALAGADVVRLKGGDPFVFGRGGEEWLACVEAGVQVRVIPGVTSSIAVPGLAGIPVTHRGLAQGFVVVSGHVSPHDPRSDVDWPRLAGLGLTVVVLMGVVALDDITSTLIDHGMDPETPVACVADGGMPSQRVATAPLAVIAATAREQGIRPPAVTVIGPAVSALDSVELARTGAAHPRPGPE